MAAHSVKFIEFFHRSPGEQQDHKLLYTYRYDKIAEKSKLERCVEQESSSPCSSLWDLKRFIMPLGHKSRHHGCQKHPQAKDDTQGVVTQEAGAPAAGTAAAVKAAAPVPILIVKVAVPSGASNTAAIAAAAVAAVVAAQAPANAEASAAAPAPAAVKAVTPASFTVAAAKAMTPAKAATGEQKKEASFTQGPCGAVSCSPALTPRRRSPSAGALSADGSVVSPDQCSSCKNEECISEASHCTGYMSEGLQCQIETLGSFILKKFELKQSFTRSEMLLLIDRNYTGEFPQIFKSVCEHLEAAFAVEVREVEPTHHSYSVFSMLSLPNNGRVHPGRGYPKSGLLMKILALILMKGHRASEADVWKFLKKMHVYPRKEHMFFGNASNLLTHDFVKLKYLEYWQVPGYLRPRREFLWGPQAHAEISKEKIMKYLIRMNKICPTYFSYLYEDLGRVEIEQFQDSLSTKHVSTG
ncbi:melanoma-associated antigen B5-like [Cavia porcellus]|uniref:melanoma-associated antigen B5-like n=1 Tax=Cavia porcellus TaxID=10141 RepID=UPI002FE265D7